MGGWIKKQTNVQGRGTSLQFMPYLQLFVNPRLNIFAEIQVDREHLLMTDKPNFINLSYFTLFD